jgi:adenylate kinase
MALNLVMLGPPGAGKGTQARTLAAVRGVPHISTGDMLREAVAAGTAIGLRARAVMEQGLLVSDEIIVGVVRERLAKADALAGFVLDGFPRTVPQAEALDAIVAGRDPLVVVDIAVADDELVRRLTSRRVCGRCGANADVPAPGQAVPAQCTRCGGALTQRADDREEVIRERLRVYERDTRPLLDYYRGRSGFWTVNGAQAPGAVAADVAAAVASAGAAGRSSYGAA